MDRFCSGYRNGPVATVPAMELDLNRTLWVADVSVAKMMFIPVRLSDDRCFQPDDQSVKVLHTGYLLLHQLEQSNP